MSQYRTYRGYRIYEGEWTFVCTNASCRNGTVIEYSLNDYEDFADYFLDGRGIHTNAWCEKCNSNLEWAGYSGGSPISDSLVSLVESQHYMAATVILSAIMENLIGDLLWASLVDNGVDAGKANSIADSRIGRIESVNMIRSLTDIQINDITFPVRNLVAHGKGFSYPSDYFIRELISQIEKILSWVKRLIDGREIESFNPPECDRWLMFVSHWSAWLEAYLKPMLNSGIP